MRFVRFLKHIHKLLKHKKCPLIRFDSAFQAFGILLYVIFQFLYAYIDA